MKKILLVLLISFHVVQSQDRVLELDVDLNQNSEVFSIVNNKNGNTAFFTLKGRQIEAFLFDDNFRETARIKPAKIPNKFDVFSGYIIENKEVHLFLSNTTKSKFAKILFNFTSGESIFTELNLDLKDARFLESISQDGNFFIISLPDHSETIRIYKFHHTNSPAKFTIDFSNSNYLNERNKPAKFNSLFSTYKGFNKVVEVGKMEKDQPNSIQEASKKVKIFTTDEKLMITLDENHYFTYLLEINWKDFQGKMERIEKPRLSEEINHKSSNSFILDDRIYQVVTTKDALKFHIVDLQDKKPLNSHSVKKDEEIYFKNTPIIQEGGAYTSHREYEKTSKFIRKMKNLPIAITAIEKDGKYQINLGSSLEIKTNPMMGFGMAGGAVGGMASGMTVGFNSMMLGYVSYGFSRTVEINGLFDEGYKPIKGDINPNIFDRIKEISENNRNISTETIFIKNGSYYWGYYDNYNNTYKIHKI